MALSMSVEEADADLLRLASEHDRITAALLDLDGHPTRRLLDVATLTGGTKRRWDDAETAIALLWGLYRAYQDVLRQAREVRARKNRPGHAELSELALLLRARSVQLVGAVVPLGERSLAGPLAPIEQLSLIETVRRMEPAFEVASDVVAAVDTVWSDLNPRLDGLSGRLGVARRLAESFKARTADVAAVAQRLDELRTAIQSDPLGFAGPAGTDAGRADAIGAELAALYTELDRAGRTKDELAGKMTTLTGGLDRLVLDESDAGRERDLVASKISAPAVPVVPRVSTALRARLDRLADLASEGRWLRLAEEVAAVGQALTTAGEQLRVRRMELAALLERRTELRGRLDAYRAKAARLGHLEDTELSGRYDEARALLWTSPCDLEAAAAAVTRYQRAVLARDVRTVSPAPTETRNDHV